jgi:hypothetical protein
MIKFLRNLGDIYPNDLKGEFKKLYNELKNMKTILTKNGHSVFGYSFMVGKPFAKQTSFRNHQGKGFGAYSLRQAFQTGSSGGGATNAMGSFCTG